MGVSGNDVSVSGNDGGGSTDESNGIRIPLRWKFYCAQCSRSWYTRPMVAQPAPTPSLIDQLLSKAAEYLSDDEVSAVEEAYVFASGAHAGQFRKSGGPFIEHPVSTALYLANLRLDSTVLIAALLHDVVEDTSIAQNDISRSFGGEVAELVDGVTKLTSAETEERRRADSPRPTSNADASARAATLRKMLMTMVKDFRVVLIKFADRLHNMQTLGALREDRRRAIAQETLDFYAPLAHRLGIWEFKWQLEDLAFQHIDPEAYRAVSKMLGANRREREQYVDRVVHILEDVLEKKGIEAQVTGRPKNIYSIHRKTQRYVKMNRTAKDIYDLFALRVIVDTVDDCYAALGAVHAKWPPLPGEFDDYIANPKDNMYKSLHTAVKCEGTSPVEVQIRTVEMHRLAEYGVAAHWLYKGEGGVEFDEAYDRKMTWIRQLLDWQRDVFGAEEYVEAAETETLDEKIFVYTPRGDLMEMPAGSTPLDFAYRIHSDLGHHSLVAEVNERLVPLNHQLKVADTVHIITAKTLRGPSRDWLNENLGYLKTSHARSLVRRWFNRQERRANIQIGRDFFTKEFRRLGWTMSAQEVADLMAYDSLEEFFAALGDGSLSIRRVRKMVLPDTEPEADHEANMEFPEPISVTEVLGAGGLSKRIATCCNPAAGDAIIGYVTRNNWVSVHRRICTNVTGENVREYLRDDVYWDETKGLYPVRIRVESWDRVGLLGDVTSLVADEGVNIVRSSTVPEDGISIITLSITIESIEQLSRLLNKIEGVSDVFKVSRVPDDPPMTLQPVSGSPSPPSLE